MIKARKKNPSGIYRGGKDLAVGRTGDGAAGGCVAPERPRSVAGST